MKNELEKEIEHEIERQINILKTGAEEIIPEKDLREKIKKSLINKKPLNIKYGIDPTGDSIHIGHAVIIRKLKQFQDLGHNVQFLIGDYTARIGDPTGKNETRKVLTNEDIEKNMKDYLRQVAKILDLNKISIHYNSEWLGKLKMEDILKLTSVFTVSLMTSREDFAKRLKENKPISLVELMYPILQGYDSVALESDIELGATEQKFNILRGRDLQRYFQKERQVCMLFPILEGLDGKNKMSKSLNNYVALEDVPNDMYGKIMSIPDELIIKYFNLTTDIESSIVNQLEMKLKNNEINPMEIKKKLAYEIVKQYYDVNKAQNASNYFTDMFTKRVTPQDIKIVEVDNKEYNVIDIILELGFAKSKSEVRRLILGNAVSLNGEKIKDINHIFTIDKESILKCGKKKIVNLKIKK